MKRVFRLVAAVFAFLHLGFAAFANVCLPKEAVNPTSNADSTLIAYTIGGDLYVLDRPNGRNIRLTDDGSDVILNGYSSWVYYEEIFGRATRYCAFWWSPDGKKLAFYRFDNTEVPVFPIYSAEGQYGSLLNTRYPKAGCKNPDVQIAIINNPGKEDSKTVWADFPQADDCYYGTPFWSDDSNSLYVGRMPRLQNELDLYKVCAASGQKENVYHETYKTWVEWPSSMIFTPTGLYFVRCFETNWEQIYYLDLSLKNKPSRKIYPSSSSSANLYRLTDQTLWATTLIGKDAKGILFFISKNDASMRNTVYSLDVKGRIKALTPTDFDAADVKFTIDCKSFTARLSNAHTPFSKRIYSLSYRNGQVECKESIETPAAELPERTPVRTIIYMTTEDGTILPASIVYPFDFDPSKKYPLHCEIYGGPGTEYVRDRYAPRRFDRFFAENGIINVTMDSRVAGHNGRKGLDCVYKDFTSQAIADFVEWGKYFQSLPYVDGSRIGVEGFSFGGTMTTLLLLRHSDIFCCGIAGGGVYDWSLYDSNYTERFMQTPQLNPEGYKRASALTYINEYKGDEPVLMITHGTGDDNVHFQNTLQLIDALQKAGKQFEFMIYPDGKHGYRGLQADHDFETASRFWLKHLKN
ncbi:MAG: DPP IV N-terminal domain-containing protein [Bacteroidales bacterium]|nr:DPP IV N-terminal domain-containing protein [Bacteroidales bacterium]